MSLQVQLISKSLISDWLIGWLIIGERGNVCVVSVGRVNHRRRGTVHMNAYTHNWPTVWGTCRVIVVRANVERKTSTKAGQKKVGDHCVKIIQIPKNLFKMGLFRYLVSHCFMTISKVVVGYHP